MAIKYNIQGLLIYLALAAYLAALVASIARRPRLGLAMYRLAFALTAAGLIYRGLHVAHIPMQNLFEVFLVMALMSYPIAAFAQKIMAIPMTAADIIIGIVVLFPAAFVFSDEPQALPPALQCWLFAPHVAVYMLSYMILAKAAVPATLEIFKSPAQSPARLTSPSLTNAASLAAYESAAYRLVCLAFPLLTLGLLLGSWWAALAWGDFWGWDPKELWSLVTWLVYLAYFHFRYRFGRRYPRLNCAGVILGLIAVIITLLWVNLSRIFSGLHSYAS